MTLLLMEELFGPALDTKMQALGSIETNSYYNVEQNKEGKHTLVVGKKRVSSDLQVCQAFWHFVTLHEDRITPDHEQVLSNIYKRLHITSKNDQKKRTLAQLDALSCKLQISAHPLKTKQHARFWAERIETLIRNDRFDLVGQLLCHFSSQKTAVSKASIIMSSLLTKECRKKLPEILKNNECVLTSLSVLTYSQSCETIQKVLKAIVNKNVTTLHLGWGNPVEQVIEYHVLPLISQCVTLEQLTLGTPMPAIYPRGLNLSDLTRLPSLKSLSLNFVSLNNATAQKIMKISTIQELSIVENPNNSISDAFLQDAGSTRLTSLRLEGNRTYRLPFLSAMTALQKLLLFPFADHESMPGYVTADDIPRLKHLTQLSLYSDAVNDTLFKKIVKELQQLVTLEIRVSGLRAKTLQTSLAHPSLRALRITTKEIHNKPFRTESFQCQISKLVLRIADENSSAEQTQAIQAFMPPFMTCLAQCTSITDLTLAIDHFNKECGEILATRQQPLARLALIFSSEIPSLGPIRPLAHKVRLISLKNPIDPKVYRKLMVTWHEQFPLSL